MRSVAERRWAIIALDGRHVWLGRHSDPPDEIAAAETTLAAQGTPAWVVVMSGDYWSGGVLEVVVVQSLAGADEEAWLAAWAAFLASRDARLRTAG